MAPINIRSGQVITKHSSEEYKTHHKVEIYGISSIYGLVYRPFAEDRNKRITQIPYKTHRSGQTYDKPASETEPMPTDTKIAAAKTPIYNTGMYSRLKGKIMLKVEDAGKAYYINPQNETMHYLGRPHDAFSVMREQGIGITNKDLYKIPVGTTDEDGLDSDGDGLSDYLEDTLGLDANNNDTDNDGYADGQELAGGYNPWGDGNQSLDSKFAGAQTGKILLQIEKAGEAWYVNPADNRRYFLGRPRDAFTVMRNLGLGIPNSDFNSL